MSDEKKDVSQKQLEKILKHQFSRTQDWQGLCLLAVIVIPFTLLAMWGFSDVNFWLRLVVYVVLGITLVKCEEWVVNRRIRKTIEAMKAL
jgi:hypothetical protein